MHTMLENMYVEYEKACVLFLKRGSGRYTNSRVLMRERWSDPPRGSKFGYCSLRVSKYLTRPSLFSFSVNKRDPLIPLVQRSERDLSKA